MKIAITGKGGVGKSTLAGVLAQLANRHGQRVLAVDADPDANLAFALGIPAAERNRIVPIAQRADLIEERTGARIKQFGQIFKLNPDITDVAERCGYTSQGIHLVVLGAIEAGGSGCACPEAVFLRQLLSHILLSDREFVVVDMEAGIEHLGRGTAQGVDVMVVVVEPTTQSLTTAHTIRTLSQQIGIKSLAVVGNKLVSESDSSYLQDHLTGFDILGYIPYSESIRRADQLGIPMLEQLDARTLASYEFIYQGLSRFVNRGRVVHSEEG